MRLLVPLFVVVILHMQSHAQNEISPIGLWREHLPYNSAIDITAGNSKIYCATPYSLFTIDLNENSVERLSKSTGLSETGINAIQFDQSNNKLFIAYTNRILIFYTEMT
jgi:hypothetical protein